VQLKGLSEAQFAVLYGTEDQCGKAVMRWRWPSGFVCPVAQGSITAWSRPGAFTSVPPVDADIRDSPERFRGTKVRCALGFAPCTTSQSKGGISSIEWAAGLASPRPPLEDQAQAHAGE